MRGSITWDYLAAIVIVLALLVVLLLVSSNLKESIIGVIENFFKFLKNV